MSESLFSSITASFLDRFGGSPARFQSPGRINLIGEHTDYNGGFVLPAGIDLCCRVVIAPTQEARSVVVAFDLNEEFSFDANALPAQCPTWAAYILGVIHAMGKRGKIIGNFLAVFSSDIPIGAGLSSSAALESVFAFALNDLFRLQLDRMELTRIAQQAENEYVGLQCGIMDMFASIHARKDQAIQLDCRTLDFHYVPLHMNDHLILLVDTGIKHELASSEYNVRRQECEEVVRLFHDLGYAVQSLRDITMQQLEMQRDRLSPLLLKRARHVVSENERVLEFVKSMQEGDWQSAGQLLYASHYSLRDDYAVSCNELDFLVKTVKPLNGVIGSRMMGGGFGGCTISIVEKSCLEAVMKAVNFAYQESFGIAPKSYIAQTGNGACAI